MHELKQLDGPLTYEELRKEWPGATEVEVLELVDNGNLPAYNLVKVVINEGERLWLGTPGATPRSYFDWGDEAEERINWEGILFERKDAERIKKLRRDFGLKIDSHLSPEHIVPKRRCIPLDELFHEPVQFETERHTNDGYSCADDTKLQHDRQVENDNSDLLRDVQVIASVHTIGLTDRKADDRAFVDRLRKEGRSLKEIAQRIDAERPGLSDAALGELLPANPGATVKREARRSRGQRLRGKK